MIMVLKLIGMFAVIVVSPVSGVQLTFTRNRVIMGAPGETVMTCAVDETDIRDLYFIKVSVFSKMLPNPTEKVIAMVTRTGLDDATNANLGDLANRIRIEGSIATNLRDSRITVTFDTEKLQCADAAYYRCTINYITSALVPKTSSVNTSLEVYEYPVMGKLVVKHNGIEVNEGTSSRKPTFNVGDQIELSCSASVGSINTTLIQWRRTTEIGRENIWNEYQPSAAASSDGDAVRENCGYIRTATILYNMTIADADRLNNLGFECYVRVSDPIYNNYVTPDSTNPKFYADVSGVNGGNAQQNASTDSTKCTQKGDCIGYKSDCIDGSCNCSLGYTLHTNGKDCQQNIDRSATYSFKAVPQNRKVHQMTTSRPGKITVRDQSCYTCDNCLAGEKQCENQTRTGEDREFDISGGNRTSLDSFEEESSEDVADLINVGDTVAVVADDDEDDYFLLKVSEEPMILQDDVRDDWGNTFASGASIVAGDYYTRTTSNTDGSSTYKLVKKKRAIVYTVAVCFVLDTRDKRGTIHISDDIHHDILSNIGCLDVW